MIRRTLFGALVGVVVLAHQVCAQTLYPDPLGAPGDYSFAPPVAQPAAARPGGVASLSYGSRNMSQASIRMDSGLIGNAGVRAFVALGGGRGPDLTGIVPGAKGGVVSHGAAVGLEKSFADGTTISLGGNWEQDRLPLGRRPLYPP